MAAIAHGISETTVDQTHTGDTNWTTKVTVASTNFVAGGKYLIVCTAQVGGDDANAIFGFRLAHGATPTVFLGAEMVIEPASLNDWARTDYGYLTVFDQPGGGAEDIIFQLWTADSGNTAKADSIILWWIRLDADLIENTDWVYSEDDYSGSPFELAVCPTYSTLSSLNNVGANGETWLLLGCMDYRPSATNYQIDFWLNVATDAEDAPRFSREPEDTSEQLTWLLARAMTLTGARSMTLRGCEESASANCDVYSGHLFALRLDAFADAQIFWNGSDISLAQDTWTEIGDLDFTPSTQADFMLLAFATAEDPGSFWTRMQDGGTTYPTGRDDKSDAVYNDPTDRLSTFSITQRNLAASPQDIDLDGKVTMTGGAFAQNRVLVAVSMELAAAGTPVTINAVTATATAEGKVPALKRGATLAIPISTATATAIVPSLSLDAVLAAALAQASGQALTPIVSLPKTVIAALATATADIPTPALRLGIGLTSPIATAQAETLAPTIIVVGPTIILAPTATATADALVPTIKRDRVFGAPVAQASAEALAPALALGLTVQAAIAEATAGTLSPSILRDAVIGAVTAMAAAGALAPTIGTGMTITVPIATAIADALIPSLEGVVIIGIIELAGEFLTQEGLDGRFLIADDLAGEFITQETLEGDLPV